MLARAYLENGQAAEAAGLLDSLESRGNQSRLVYAIWDLTADCYLGLAYEGTGDTARAVEAYKRCSQRLAGAEPRLPEQDIVDTRLKALRQGL
jgi:hypothetical protein